MSEILVFVYGTLRKGQMRNVVLQDHGAKCISEQATLEGFDLYDLGPFPAILPGKHSTKGELYSVGPDCLRLLDQIEGHREAAPETSFYRRTRVVAKGAQGEPFKCWAYVLQGGADRVRTSEEVRRIPSGDWVETRLSL